ncbi:VOC family protein [Nocardia sp. NPDC051052]|uniref:VOC family protein n=1 Tax=Nocardia sp. NPDC051052 TaxID=3364322 RepID=UPI0037B6DC04
MPIQRLNHAVLYVRDVERSAEFYRAVLGFRPVFTLRDAAFLQAEGSTNDHDLGLIQPVGQPDHSAAGQRTVGLYHLAWEAETLAELRQLRGKLAGAGALVSEMDHGTTKSLYAKDPGGLEFEVCWLVPAALIAVDDHQRVGDALDLDADIRRYGADTRSGVGVSSPAEN